MLPKATEYFVPQDHKTTEEVRRKVHAAIEEYDELLTLAKKWKVSFTESERIELEKVKVMGV